MIPLFEKDGFLITFEATPEPTSMRRHFIKECGWTEAQFRKIKDDEWFQVEVGAWREGKQWGAEYLGCCCYKTEAEFYTTYKDGYFADLVKRAVEEAKRNLAQEAAKGAAP